ncbi:hypothetical protein HHK36_003412 [Tetracentron sinense]|uniref:Uncharacterized protein n=1 Tax=Tetracentron sinense TaxID=13715 RepID=A0A834ZSV3_TETSI|nr:hypothetical protein HHK36_003412 [Tetracentron sinense]
MASSIEVPVFIDTNISTHIAMAVSPDIRAGDFKRQLEREHSICFSQLGEIRVHGLMVKRKSCFYHLPDSVPIKHAFHGLKGTWFLHMEASRMTDSDKPCLSEGLAAELKNNVSNGSNVTYSQEPKNHNTCMNNNTKNKFRKRRRKGIMCLKDVLEELLTPIYVSNKKKERRPKEKKRRWRRLKEEQFLEYSRNGTEKGFLSATEKCARFCTKERFGHFGSGNEVECRRERISSPMVETHSVSSSEVVSVTGIITKYFYNGSPSISDIGDDFGGSSTHQLQLEEPLKAETDEYCSNVKIGVTPQYTANTPPRMLFLPLPADPSPDTSRAKLGRTEVGKRLVLAANNLGISVSKKPAVSLCRSKGGKLLVSNSSPLVRSLIFEISDNDD